MAAAIRSRTAAGAGVVEVAYPSTAPSQENAMLVESKGLALHFWGAGSVRERAARYSDHRNMAGRASMSRRDSLVHNHRDMVARGVLEHICRMQGNC